MSPKSILLLALALPTAVLAADNEVNLAIKDHLFNPAEIRIKAGVKVKIIVQNQDSTAEEFESHELNREKVIPANSKATIFVGPLSPGRYPFYGEFNAKTARGQIIVE